jgi:subtilisin family serine protease
VVYPAAYSQWVIGVSGITQSSGWGYKYYSRWPEANRSATVELAAPADNISYISYEGRIGLADGVSYAVPLVAASAALLKSAYPQLSWSQIRDCLYRSGDPYVRGFDLPGGYSNVERAHPVRRLKLGRAMSLAALMANDTK